MAALRPTAFALAVLVTFSAGVSLGYAIGQTSDPPAPTATGALVARITAAEHRDLAIECASDHIAATAWRTASEPLLWERQAARDLGYEYERLAALTCGLAGVSDK